MHQAYQDDMRKIYLKVGSGSFLWGYVEIRKKPDLFRSRYLIEEDPREQNLLNQKVWRLTRHTYNQCKVLFGPEPVHAKRRAEADLYQKMNSVRVLKCQYTATSRGRA